MKRKGSKNDRDDFEGALKVALNAVDPLPILGIVAMVAAFAAKTSNDDTAKLDDVVARCIDTAKASSPLVETCVALGCAAAGSRADMLSLGMDFAANNNLE